MKTDKLLVKGVAEAAGAVTKAEVLAVIATAIEVPVAAAAVEVGTVTLNHRTNARCPPTPRRNGIRFPQRNRKASKRNERQPNAERLPSKPET
jgi:hypothetical protein